jgi:pimeloyl-ACP methyl ester carboxylesterase
MSAFHCRFSLPLVVACLAFSAGCARQVPDIGVTPLKAADPAELQQYLLSRKPDLDLFRLRGPFRVTERKAVEVRLGTDESVSVDLFLCAAAETAPLVILLHGHGNVKEDHAFQAMHLASWGMHAMPLQLPSYGPWIANGRKLVTLVKAIRQAPGIADGRADVSRIILVGHSFGATAVSAALGEGAAVTGAILLDPAGIGRQLPALLKKVDAPVMLIGADEEVWPTRNRAYFYRFIPAGIAEISIRDAVHEDAQYPTERTVRGFEDGPLDTEEAQITFVAALTAAAFSLSATGTLDYAWSSFEGVFATGRFFNARRK